MDVLAVWLQATQEQHEAGDATTLPPGWAEGERALARLGWAMQDTEPSGQMRRAS